MTAPLPGHDTAGYRAVLRRLAGLDAEAAAHRAEAVAWHDGRVVAADEAVRAAEQDVRAAEHAVRMAEREREKVDARAAGIWADFVHQAGGTAERFGRTKPDPAIPRQRDRDADEYLQEATATMKRGWEAISSSGRGGAMAAAPATTGGACIEGKRMKDMMTKTVRWMPTMAP